MLAVGDKVRVCVTKPADILPDAWLVSMTDHDGTEAMLYPPSDKKLRRDLKPGDVLDAWVGKVTNDKKYYDLFDKHYEWMDKPAVDITLPKPVNKWQRKQLQKKAEV